MATAAIELAYDDLKDSFSLVLYDFTTLCFALFTQYDFQHHGFFKDNMQKLRAIVKSSVQQASQATF